MERAARSSPEGGQSEWNVKARCERRHRRKRETNLPRELQHRLCREKLGQSGSQTKVPGSQSGCRDAGVPPLRTRRRGRGRGYLRALRLDARERSHLRVRGSEDAHECACGGAVELIRLAQITAQHRQQIERLRSRSSRAPRAQWPDPSADLDRVVDAGPPALREAREGGSADADLTSGFAPRIPHRVSRRFHGGVKIFGVDEPGSLCLRRAMSRAYNMDVIVHDDVRSALNLLACAATQPELLRA